ncbi:MAG TPA: hypothetical protein VE379_05210, partial [Vicinamibacterales bacterium]|nr:hypothetical protein [Vicinamibacterales bacterium]
MQAFFSARGAPPPLAAAALLEDSLLAAAAGALVNSCRGRRTLYLGPGGLEPAKKARDLVQRTLRGGEPDPLDG